MKGWAQLLSAVLAALVSSFLILGSLVITLVENEGDPARGASTAAGRTTATAEFPPDEGIVEAPSSSPSPGAPTPLLPYAPENTSKPPTVPTQSINPGVEPSGSAASTQVGNFGTQTPEETLPAGEEAVSGFPVSTELGVVPSATPEK